MTFDRKRAGDERALISSLDLEQIKSAVSELRASSPRSVLADLVEEKIRKIENGRPSAAQGPKQEWVRQIAS